MYQLDALYVLDILGHAFACVQISTYVISHVMCSACNTTYVQMDGSRPLNYRPHIVF